jgi:hypothetical protein
MFTAAALSREAMPPSFVSRARRSLALINLAVLGNSG